MSAYLILYIALSMGIAALTNWKSSLVHEPTELFFTYASPFVLLGAGSLFKYVYGLQLFKMKSAMILIISRQTFRIYLIHPLILATFLNVDIKWNSFNPTFWIPIYALLIFGICAILSLMIENLLKCFTQMFVNAKICYKK